MMEIPPEDARILLELAASVEDKTPHEQAAIESVAEALERQDRSLEQSLEQRLGRGGRGR
jgi:hypothetical protein